VTEEKIVTSNHAEIEKEIVSLAKRLTELKVPFILMAQDNNYSLMSAASNPIEYKNHILHKVIDILIDHHG